MAKYHKPATFFAAIFTLIQSIVWACLSIYSCAIFECKLSFPLKPLDPDTPKSASLFFFTYLRGYCYSHTDGLLWESPAAGRTYRWMTAYAIISCIWLPCAALLLGAAINNLRGKYITYMIYPWLVLTGVVLLVDLITTIVYAVDISKTLTTSDYLNFIGITVSDDVPGLSGLSGVTVLPSVEMTLFFSKVIIIFIINAVLFGVIVQVVHGIRKRSTISDYLPDSEIPTVDKSDREQRKPFMDRNQVFDQLIKSLETSPMFGPATSDDFYASRPKDKEEDYQPTDATGGGWINSGFGDSSSPSRLQPSSREKIPLGPLPVVRVYDEPTFTRVLEEEYSPPSHRPPPRYPPPQYPPPQHSPPQRPPPEDIPPSPVYDVRGRPVSNEPLHQARVRSYNGTEVSGTPDINPNRPFTYLPITNPTRPKKHVTLSDN